jgi:hypothetical protein
LQGCGKFFHSVSVWFKSENLEINAMNSTTASAVQPNTAVAPTYEELKARIAELEKGKAVRQAKAIYFKVSAKGGVSVYGLNSIWPVTLYLEQWERFFEAIERLKNFIAEHRSELASKPPKAE